MSYKEKVFDSYVSTHIAPRKGSATLEQFKARSLAWRGNFGKFFPADRNARVIDLGCGEGALVWWLQRQGYAEAEGIDISKEQVELAVKLGVKNVVLGDIETYLKDKAGYYDVMVMRDVLEHFPKEQMLHILEVCRNSLRDNGCLVIQVPNALSPFFGGTRYGDITHELAFSQAGLSQVLNLAGFSELSFHTVNPVAGSIKSLIRYFLWKGVEAFYRMLLFAELGKGRRIVSQNIIAQAVKREGKKDA